MNRTTTIELQVALLELELAVHSLIAAAQQPPDQHWVSSLQARLLPSVAAVDQVRRLLADWLIGVEHLLAEVAAHGGNTHTHTSPPYTREKSAT
jgi:hypothetical protein